LQRFLDSAGAVATATRSRLLLALAAMGLAAGCSTTGSPSQDSPDSPASAVPAALPVKGVRAVAAPSAVMPPVATPIGVGEADGTRWTGREEMLAPGSLWDRIRNGFAMPELDTSLVAEKERFYLSRPDYLERMFERGGRYLFHIVEEIEKRGMPTELALLPFVESAMNPVALSHASAAGLWQFIPSTGRAYNLDQNWWVDNRRDVVKSTDAALDYLQNIYEMHGHDWFLALASYNWGEGAVGRAIKRNRAKGLPTDYLSLRMPNETRHYVPKLIALKHIIERAAVLGVDLPDLPNRPYFVTIEKTRPIDLKLAARFAGMSVKEFVALNPAHNRPVIAASRNNEIKLPADRVDAFIDAVERHGQDNRPFATWQPYTLKQGDSLEGLAKRAGVTTAELREANGLRGSRKLLPGTRILSPHREVEDETRVETFDGPRVYELVERPALYHRVGARESLSSIAKRYGTSVSQLRALNKLESAVAKRGARLIVRPASSLTMLTTERGQRRIVEQDEPRVMRAVLREEVEVAPGQTASSAAGKSKLSQGEEETSSKTSARTRKPTIAVPKARAVRTSQQEPAPRRVDKRT
jgi:membrane-bound lytic murein transglycosylase D